MFKTLIVHGNSTFELLPKEYLSDSIKCVNQFFNMLPASEVYHFHAYIRRSRSECFVVTVVPFSNPGNISLAIDNLNDFLK